MPLYSPLVYDCTLPANSYWETTIAPRLDCSSLQTDQACEVAIIGGGITGLSAALHLAKDHGIQAQVLEAGTIAWGASGRNGGFCCIGATRLSYDALLKQFGREETFRYFQDQRSATELVQQLAIEEGMAIDPQGAGEIQVAHLPSRMADLEEEYEFLTKIAEYPCQLWSQKDLSENAYHSPQAHGGLFVGVGFGLNPLKYSRGLASAALQRGATLHENSPVMKWDKGDGWHWLHTPGGTLRAKRVIVATNGYTQDGLHSRFDGRLLPVLSNIITTRPLTQAELDAQGWRTETPVFDTRNLLFYYRLLKDGRFLFGSRGGVVGNQAERDRRQQDMIASLAAMFPAWNGIEITHYWNGLACLSAALVPHVGQLADDPSVFYGLAYHGNGVATGTWSGRAVARLVAGSDRMENLCAIVRQPLQQFPLARLRVWSLRFMYAIYGMRDRLP